MKTPRLFFMIVGFGALTLGLGFAGEPSKQPAEQDSHENHTAGARPAGRAQGKRDQVDRTHSQFIRSSQASPISTQTKRTSGNEVHQSVLKKPATAANEGLMANKTGNHLEQLAKVPVGSGSTALLPGVVHGRSANAAVIGGMTPSSAKHSAAAVDGAGIKRKP